MQINLGGKTAIHTMNHITSGFLTTITWWFSRINYMVHFQNDRRKACLCQCHCLFTVLSSWPRTLNWQMCHFLRNSCFLFIDICLHYPHNAVTFDAIWSSLARFREMLRANVNDVIWSTYVMWISIDSQNNYGEMCLKCLLLTTVQTVTQLLEISFLMRGHCSSACSGSTPPFSNGHWKWSVMAATSSSSKSQHMIHCSMWLW